MANYKVIDADQLDTNLTTIANSIRSRARTTENLVFPKGFVSAVNNLVDSKGILDGSINGVITIPQNVTKLRRGAFSECTAIAKVTFHDGVTAVGVQCFYGCSNLRECILPVNVKMIGEQTFCMNYNLSKVDCWLTSISGAGVFLNCALPVLIIRSETVCTLANSTALNGTQIAKKTGYIYVPRALVESYKSAANWSTHASQFRAIEDYPSITGGTV